MSRSRSSTTSPGSQTPTPSPSWEKTREAGTAPWDPDAAGTPDEFARPPRAGSESDESGQQFGSGGAQSGAGARGQQFGAGGEQSGSDGQQHGFAGRQSEPTRTKQQFGSGEGRTGGQQSGFAGEQSGASNSGDFSQTAQGAVGLAKEQVTKFASGIVEQLSRSVEDQKKQGIEAIRDFARAINTAAGELEEHSPQVARFVRDAAGQVESFSGNIENKSIGDLMQQVTSLARSQPTLFIGGALAAGFALSRFIKSSTSSRMTQNGGQDFRSTGTGPSSSRNFPNQY